MGYKDIGIGIQFKSDKDSMINPKGVVNDTFSILVRKEKFFAQKPKVNFNLNRI